MGRLEDFRTVVDAAYAAALEPALWPQALVELSDAIGAEGATIEIINHRRQAHEFLQFGRLPDDRHEDYRQHYFHVCPRIPAVARARRHDIIADYDFTSEAEMERDPFYSEFLAPHGMRYFLSSAVIRDSTRSALLSPQFSTRHGHADDEDIAFLRTVTPHFERAVDIFLRLEAHRSRTAQVETLLSDANAGVILVDRELTVAWTNPAVERILEENAAAVSISQGRLHLSDERSREALSAMIAAAAQSAVDATSCAANCKVYVARDGKPPLLVTLLPLIEGDMRERVASHAAFAVIIEDPAQLLPLHADALMTSFHLTPVEADVAIALANGATPAEIATRRGVSMATVRTHIARTLEKTGCRSIVDLVRLLALTAAWK